MDLLSYGDPDITVFEEVFRDLCAVEVEPDALVFQPDSVKGERIRDEEKYALAHDRFD